MWIMLTINQATFEVLSPKENVLALIKPKMFMTVTVEFCPISVVTIRHTILWTVAQLRQLLVKSIVQRCSAPQNLLLLLF